MWLKLRWVYKSRPTVSGSDGVCVCVRAVVVVGGVLEFDGLLIKAICESCSSWFLTPGVSFTRRFDKNSESVHPEMRETGFSVSEREVRQTWERGVTPSPFTKRGKLSPESVAMVTESVKFRSFLQQILSFSLSPPSFNARNTVSFPHSFTQSVYHAHFSQVLLTDQKAWLI